MDVICNEILQECGFLNKSKDIYDEAVIERNGWLMYGSNKPSDDCRWKLAYLYNYINNGGLCLVPNTYTDEELVEKLSIRNKHKSNKMLKDLPVLPAKDIDALSDITVTTNHTQNVVLLHESKKKEIELLVNMLDISRAEDYNSWMRVGWCLFNTSVDLLPVWIQFSKKFSRFQDGDCERLWSKMKPGSLHIGSLHRWAQDDNPEEYALFKASRERMTGNLETLEDVFNCDTVLEYSKLKNIFEKTHMFIQKNGVYIEEDEDRIEVRDERQLKRCYGNLHCKVIRDGEERNGIFIKEWIKDSRIRMFKRMDFLPPPRVCPESTYNLWKGFAVDKIECTSSGNIEPFLEHCRILTGRNDNAFLFFIKFIAQLVQQPGKIPGIAPVFKSKEGAGKNIFLDHFASIIGTYYFYETACPETDLFGRFSNARKNRLLINIDASNAKVTFVNSEVLKNMITSTHINYEQKGIDPIEMSNYCRFFFTTNNLMSVKISDSDRRYFILDVSNEKIGDAEYFKGFSEYMQDVTNQKAIIEHLRSVDISNVNWIKDRPISETYKSLKGLCLGPLHKYLFVLWENHRLEEYYRVKATDLMDGYIQFLDEKRNTKEGSPLKKINTTSFGRDLRELMDDETCGITKHKSEYQVIKTLFGKQGSNK